MAAGDKNSDDDKTNNAKDNAGEKENLWSSILNDVQNRGNAKLPSCKQILVLGDNESGKTTLVAKLQGVEDPKKGWGLEYAYIDVRDDYRDDHTRLSVWVLDGDPGHSHLLRFALNEETFEHTLVILTVTMTAPWGILEQLQGWVSVLADHIDKLKLDSEVRQRCRQRLVKTWQEYVEPGDELNPLNPEAQSPLRRSSRNLDDADDESQALSDGILTNNLGLDIVVVVTKTDYMSTLEKDQDYRDEQLDFMQQWIRRFCLQYGTALFYISAKEDKNCDLLYKYLTHRIYGLPFRTPALVVEKDAVFIPAGWDNMKKVQILYENMHTCKPDDYYRDIIVQPSTRKAVSSREHEVTAEEEQTFLARQQQQLLAGAPAGGARPGESPGRPLGPRTPGSPSKKPEIGGRNIQVGTPAGEGVLANFFNSLLHKKTGASPGAAGAAPGNTSLGPGASPQDKASMRSDVAVELDRLSKKPATPNTSGVDFNASDC